MFSTARSRLTGAALAALAVLAAGCGSSGASAPPTVDKSICGPTYYTNKVQTGQVTEWAGYRISLLPTNVQLASGATVQQNVQLTASGGSTKLFVGFIYIHNQSAVDFNNSVTNKENADGVVYGTYSRSDTPTDTRKWWGTRVVAGATEPIDTASYAAIPAKGDRIVAALLCSPKPAQPKAAASTGS